jgi:hypothetical protein
MPAILTSRRHPITVMGHEHQLIRDMLADAPGEPTAANESLVVV